MQPQRLDIRIWFPLVVHREHFAIQGLGREIAHSTPDWLHPDWESLDYPAINDLEAHRQWFRKQLHRWAMRINAQMTPGNQRPESPDGVKEGRRMLRDAQRLLELVVAQKNWSGAPTNEFVTDDPNRQSPQIADYLRQIIDWINAQLDASRANRNPQLRSPQWNHQRRVLVFAGQIVKRFVRAAKNQFRVLDAFEEENWPSEILDPLPGDGKTDQRQRLHGTINALNANRRVKLIEFRTNGMGTGFSWREADSKST
jgi:hypothetical protein